MSAERPQFDSTTPPVETAFDAQAFYTPRISPAEVHTFLQDLHQQEASAISDIALFEAVFDTFAVRAADEVQREGITGSADSPLWTRVDDTYFNTTRYREVFTGAWQETPTAGTPREEVAFLQYQDGFSLQFNRAQDGTVAVSREDLTDDTSEPEPYELSDDERGQIVEVLLEGVTPLVNQA